MRNAPDSERAPAGLFVGLATLDVVHRITEAPAVNEKVTATAQFVAAGGPAANAAVTFAALGGRATLLTALGDGDVADLIRADLSRHHVDVVDAAAGAERAVPVSAVSVLESTGERSVVSLDAVHSDAEPPAGLADLVAAADVMLVDGHHPMLARAAVRTTEARSVPVVVDAGRWKPVLADVLPHATDVVCSDDFRVPNAETSASTATALVDGGVATVVITHGGDPVEWWSGGRCGTVPVPAVDAVDTLGAGDAFHGAYCFHAAEPGGDVADRIDRAARVAALRCSRVGPRAWLDELPNPRRRAR
ncbi:PfkB family carbohydrate kinase [Mycolicibacterium grossiae]|uniref:Kinase n=1 Tax=Mycolicibacterium grossiae TaxID=1552759 RepID=A0A1E8Q9N2_9MYCO|nr:PfkB family carbohydrate kinase [Mycolicibacterium grossiae]OFJ54810.1 kinase [Mycolicibacterium grossiae]QEM45531.1 kinase [Mycolicibacterium grossiae]